MLKFERVEDPLANRWESSDGLATVIATASVFDILGTVVVESPADLAELRRVLDRAEEVAGWKGKGANQ